MDPVRADGQGHVQAVVYKQRHAARPNDGEDGPGQLHELPRADGLFPQLHHADPAGHGRRHHLDQLAPSQGRPVRDQIDAVIEGGLGHDASRTPAAMPAASRA